MYRLAGRFASLGGFCTSLGPTLPTNQRGAGGPSLHFLWYPADIRKVIYTTNAIESLNRVLRNAINKRKAFPSDESVKKVLWLAIQSAAKKWTMPVRDWRMVMSWFIIEFGERVEVDH